VAPHPGRRKLPTYVTGSGEDELAAVRDLDARLRGQDRGPSNLDFLRARLRLAWLQGAEDWAQAELGLGLSQVELEAGIQTADNAAI
jgi:hypothetical protein